MEIGLTEQSKQLRRHLLNQKTPDAMQSTQGSGKADLKAFVDRTVSEIAEPSTRLSHGGLPRKLGKLRII